MKVEIDADTMLAAAKAMEDITDEVILQFCEDGLKAVASDRAMVRIIDLHIAADGFSAYDVEERELAPVVTEKLRKAVKATDETVTLESDSRALTVAEDAMRITIQHLNQGEDDIPSIQEMEHPAEAAIDTGVLKNNMEYASMAHEKVVFYADAEDVTVEADGNTETFENTVAPTMRFDADERVRTMMKIENIRAATKAVKRIDTGMTVRLGDEYPMVFEAETEETDIRVLLAPITEH